jgi:hypothetical protein
MFYGINMSYPITILTAFKMTINTNKFGVFWRKNYFHFLYNGNNKKRLNPFLKSNIKNYHNKAEIIFFVTLR